MSRRTTLRPVEVLTPTPANPPTSSAPPLGLDGGSGRGVSRVLTVVVGASVVGILALGALLVNASRPSPSPPSTPVTAPVLATATPNCPSVASFVDVVTSYERQARWGLAASTAQTALRTPGLCEQDRVPLGQKVVALSQEALFEQPPLPEDAPGQRRVAMAYADLKTLAAQYGLQAPAPLAIAQSAYDNRLFLLATVAYGDAFQNGDSSAEDRTVVRADYAAQYNLGHIWAQRADSAQRQEGLARLATACRISEQNQLSSPEACNELQTLAGPRTRWPAPLADPLTGTPRGATPARGL